MVLPILKAGLKTEVHQYRKIPSWHPQKDVSHVSLNLVRLKVKTHQHTEFQRVWWRKEGNLGKIRERHTSHRQQLTEESGTRKRKAN